MTRRALPVMLSFCSTLGCATASRRVVEAPPSLARIGPTPWAPWEAWQLPRAERPTLDIYLARTNERRPLLVLLQGSGCSPLFAIAEGGRRRMSSLLVQAEDLPSTVHVMVIEKVGVRSFEASFDPATMAGGGQRCSDDYERNVDKQLRVADVVEAIRAARALPWVSEILVAGHSEGADVAAGVGRALGRELTAVGILSGAGATQLFDFVVAARVVSQHAEAHQALLETFALAGPNPPADYRGHSFRRWQSYALRSTPLDDLRATDLPIFVAHGTDDQASRIENADLFVVELLRSARSSALFYWVLEGVDHGYVDAQGESHAARVLRRFVDWALDPGRPSGTELVPTSSGLREKCEQVATRAMEILARDGDAKLQLAIAAAPDRVRAAVIQDCLRDATETSLDCLLEAPDLAAIKACK
jgi:predicted esterase